LNASGIDPETSSMKAMLAGSSLEVKEVIGS